MENKQMKDAASIGYRGIVTLSVLRKNKVVAKHTYHNSGLTPLFAGLCGILTGTKNVVDVAPAFLALYSVKSVNNELSIAPTADWSIICKATGGSYDNIDLATPYLALDEKIFTNTSGTNPKAAFQISIPFSLITEDRIYAMALFPAAVGDSQEGRELEALAYYKLLNDDNTWNPLYVDKSAYGYSLLIDWQMDFSNKEA